MKLCLKILAIAVIAVSTYFAIGCSAPPSFSYQNVTISFSGECADCESFANSLYYNPAYPQPPAAGAIPYMAPGGGPGGVAVFKATVTNAPPNVTWALYPQPNLGSINNPPTGTSVPVGESGSGVGSISAASGSTVVYTAPSGPPIYTGAALEQANAMGIPQGDILLVASVQADPANPASVVTANQLVQILGSSTATPRIYPYTPLTPAGITTPAVTVARGSSFAFYGFVVGAIPCLSTSTCSSAGNVPVNTANNIADWYVCPAGTYTTASCVKGGNTTLGTVTQSGVYTAPAAIPSPLPAVLVMYETFPATIISNANNYALVGVS